MRTQGWLGPVTATAFEPVNGDPDQFVVDGRNPQRLPLHPITLDPAEWTGDGLCWSPWFGVVEADFRLPLVQGPTLRNLKSALPDLSCGAFEIRLARPLPERAEIEPAIEFRGEGVPVPIPIAESLSAVRRRLDLHEHRRGATALELRHLQQEAGYALPAAYLALLEAFNGLTLYPDDFEEMRLFALDIWSVGPEGARRSAAAEAFEYGSYVHDASWFPFGQDVQGNVIWCLDERGLVRGLGKEGIVYGPDVSFETWFGDMVRDLDWAWDNRGSPVADLFLGLAGRM